MALPPRQIRYRKHALYPFIAVLFFVIITTGYSLFFSGVAPFNWLVFISYIGSIGIVIPIFYSMYKKIKSDQPVITFECDRLILHNKKNKVISWSSIIDWKIKSYKNNDSLVIRTAEGKTSVSLSLLDHTTKDIKWLMESYIRQPGPSRI